MYTLKKGEFQGSRRGVSLICEMVNRLLKLEIGRKEAMAQCGLSVEKYENIDVYFGFLL
jgi:hypothetical protein